MDKSGEKLTVELLRRRAFPILMAIHLIAITVGSLPILVDERGLKPEVFEDPLVQAEFATWARRFSYLGIEVSADEFGQGVWKAAETLLHTQRTLQQPFELYYEEAGTRQRWRMFPGAVEDPMRLRIDAYYGEATGWRTAYLMGSGAPEHQWLAQWFTRDRFRAALNLYAWNVYPGAYDEFAEWVASQAGLPLADGAPPARLRMGFEVVPALGLEQSRQRQAREPLPWAEAKGVREFELHGNVDTLTAVATWTSPADCFVRASFP